MLMVTVLIGMSSFIRLSQLLLRYLIWCVMVIMRVIVQTLRKLHQFSFVWELYSDTIGHIIMELILEVNVVSLMKRGLLCLVLLLINTGVCVRSCVCVHVYVYVHVWYLYIRLCDISQVWF